ncbi:MAG: phosphoribosylamine--glycine ligase [Myxococcota bacterium]
MRILVVGSGGREHALAWRLSTEAPGRELHLAPGNPGMAALGTLHAVAADDVPGLVALAQKLKPELVVVGPEAPLAAGLVDALRAHGVVVLGPTRAAARLETSKSWAKEVMVAAGVPTARCRLVGTEAELEGALPDGPVVLKADGLAAGKGVVVADARAEALRDGRELLQRYGAPVLVEERLSGREVSVLAVCDGENAVMLPTAQDHKRLLDGDRGPNTGGMGAVSPGTHHGRLAVDEPTLLSRVRHDVILPTLKEMRARGTPFVGVLYAGLMVDPERGTMHVLEFNARLGDPETQAILRRVQGNLGETFLHAAQGRMAGDALGVSPEAAACVVMAAQGYPGQLRTGDVIEGLAEAAAVESAVVFHAGTRRDAEGRVVTSGGRVLAVSTVGVTVAHAVERAYSAAARIRWPGVQLRRDIGRA